jgi:hypothetical protein
MRSPSAGDSRSPVSDSPSESRSIQMRPSGFSITSTTRVFEKPCDGRAERGAQHPRAACQAFRMVM